MRGRFEGWYYKHQTNIGVNGASKSLAVIPGRAVDRAFVLVITDNKSYHISYPLYEYHNDGNRLRVGRNTFTSSGVSLDIARPELSLYGYIAYTGLTPIGGDIMGPFKYFPMECRHGVISMNHTLRGLVILDGETHDFTGGRGYIESDSGRSFPKWYTWVQCNAFDEDCSIMASVARIPFYGLRFWGCICVVWLNGREYRLATYNGAKILRRQRGEIELRQGKYSLVVSVDDIAGHKLPAPQSGKMDRHIRETLSCPAWFRFMEGNCCLFEGGSDYASYECMLDG
ncbi:MAG: tocopherol cyclase family protein [Defluviitaleaceae bacterium]|nr:tocopherol cyclase family protein [Defluviitaleaceae bacterium]